MKITTTNRGFSTLLLTLIVAAIGLGAAFMLADRGIFMIKQGGREYAGAQTRMIAGTCAETLLMQVRSNPGLVSSGTLSIGSGSCQYSISGSSPNKTITITTTLNNLYKRITITTSQVNPAIVSSWVEGA